VSHATTDVDTAGDESGAAAQLHPGEHAHPSEKQYYVVALVLAVVTALEVGLYYIESLNDNVLVASLGILAVIKFAMVVMYFMHLKFDSPVFRRFFIAGLALAIGVYVATLASMHFFSGGTKFVTVS
jgi:caa(3)-type oxidase subunit IV